MKWIILSLVVVAPLLSAPLASSLPDMQDDWISGFKDIVPLLLIALSPAALVISISSLMRYRSWEKAHYMQELMEINDALERLKNEDVFSIEEHEEYAHLRKEIEALKKFI